MENAIKNRYEFVMFFDVENGNPNGDPDAGNMPRTDPETSLGIVTDVCLKRKIRNYVELVKEGEPGFNIIIKADRSLNSKFKEAYDEQGLPANPKGKNRDNLKKAQAYICKNYYDVRTFGAVMSTGDYSCGIVRGPVQISFAKSICSLPRKTQKIKIPENPEIFIKRALKRRKIGIFKMNMGKNEKPHLSNEKCGFWHF